MANADHPLIHEHAEAVDAGAAAGLRFAEKRRIGGAEDDVGGDKSWAEGLKRHRHPGGAVIEPDRRAVDDDVGRRRHDVVARPLDELGGGRGLPAEHADKLLAAAAGAVDDCDFLGTGEGEFHGDGAGSAASPEENDLLAGRWQDFGQAL